MLSVPCGSIVTVGETASPKAPRTVKETVPEVVASPVQGEVKSFDYHHGHKQHALKVGDLIDGHLRLTRIMRSDPVVIWLLDAKGETTSREVCGAGSVAAWRFS